MDDNRDILNRMENLERIVRRFRLAVAGAGTVLGGFGKLEPHDDLNVRLGRLEVATNKFNLAGNNVGVAGSFDDGFSFS